MLITSGYANSQSLIPSPEDIQITPGNFSPENRKGVTISAPDIAAPAVRLLKNTLITSSQTEVVNNSRKAAIRFIWDISLSAEAYKLHITPKFMEIRAADDNGFIYAVQTLRQLASEKNGMLTFPCVTISDAPRVGWRCFMLDSGRQFQSVPTVKKYIDMASMLKMNYFHWHLTEGLGWRIEIKRYPELARTGAFVGKGEEQQGFYSQDEIRDIVEYAAEHAITVVPEIDMPGHAEAALNAYPGLGCFGIPVQVPENGFTQNIFCAGKQGTIDFLKNVLDEVCMLFPSPYIHLGGDEAPKGNWDKCPDCQRRIKENNLENSHDLQLCFSAEMAKYLKQKGRKAIFWGDVVYQNGYKLPDNVVIQWWNFRGHKDLALRNAIIEEHPVICSTNYYNYLNFPVTPWRGYTVERTFDLKDAYLNNPSYRTEADSLILGMSCALWTDYGVTEKMIDRRLFPRILAIAELMWHKGNLEDFDRFYNRVLQKKEWFEEQGFRFGPALKETTESNYDWN